MRAGFTRRREADGRFPLLIKLLDAQEILSLASASARRVWLLHSAAKPKTEMWYVAELNRTPIFLSGFDRA